MLSLVDLLDAESVDPPLAAYLAAVMYRGHSLLVGAEPGGAGKTTVMCALLNFVPPETTLQAADGLITLRQAHEAPPDHRTCYIAHEISPASYYYAYLWGHEARQFFALGARGALIASNLHADTLDATRKQLLEENEVPSSHLDAVALKVYLGTRRQSAWAMRRWVWRVYEHAGNGDRLLWSADAPGRFTRRDESHIVSEADEARFAELLAALQAEDIRRIEAVRRALLTRLPRSGAA